MLESSEGSCPPAGAGAVCQRYLPPDFARSASNRVRSSALLRACHTLASYRATSGGGRSFKPCSWFRAGSALGARGGDGELFVPCEFELECEFEFCCGGWELMVAGCEFELCCDGWELMVTLRLLPPLPLPLVLFIIIGIALHASCCGEF